MLDLKTAGLKALPKYIENFFSNRYFKVKLENYTSRVYTQHSSVLAVTLFALKINSVADLIPQ